MAALRRPGLLSCENQERKEGGKAAFRLLPRRARHPLDTGGARLANGPKETPSDPPEATGYSLMNLHETALKTSASVCEHSSTL